MPVRAITRGLLLLAWLVWVCAGRGQAAEPLRLELQGIAGEAGANVEAALAFPPGLVKNGTVDRRWLERFVRQLPDKAGRALAHFGYYAPQIEAELKEVAEDALLLKVTIEPGAPVRLSQVRVVLEGPGAGQRRLKELSANFPLQSGDVLHQGVYEEAKKGLQAQAVALGYLDADFSRHLIRIDAADNRAEIELVLQTGPRYRFGEIRIEGAEDYPEQYLRRFLAFQSGEPFLPARLGRTQLNYLNADRFSNVRLVPDRQAAVEEQVPVDVLLEPAASKRLRPGIGYGTDTGARISLLFKNVNVGRRAHELNVELNLSQVRALAAVTYIMPDMDRLDSFTALRTGFEQEDVDAFDTRKIFVEVERVRGFGRGRRGSIYTQLFYEDFTVGGEDDALRMLVPGIRFSQLRYRDLIRPEKGYQYALELRGGHQLVGSDTGLLQLLASGNALLPLPGRLALFARIEGATTAQNEPIQDIPVSLRFFAGGDQSVRGYGYESLGPENDEGDVVGGKHLLVGSIELERALGKNWGVALFYDVGNAFDSFSELDLAQGAGVGIRRYTPIGPIRIDVAHQIGEDDSSVRFHVSIGYGW